MSNATNNLSGQPKGTTVEKAIKNGKFKVLYREIIPIEELLVGDFVSSYSLKDSAIYARQVLETKSETYSGPLITTEVNGFFNKYIPSHECLVRYRDRDNDYCVYVMRKGKAFRVGMSKMWHEDNGCGPYKRLCDENGDELWIVDTFPTRKAALLEETKISIKFRLPQTMFTFKEGRGDWTDEDFAYVWSNVDNYEDAKKAIEEYNRDITYPYFDRSKSSISIKRPHRVRACNILKNSEMYLKDSKWLNINLSREQYDGIIYSIITEKDDSHFTNNILTN